MVDKSKAESVYNSARLFYGGHEKSSNKIYVGSNFTLARGPEHDLPVAAENLAAAKQMPADKALKRVTTRWNNHIASDRPQALDNFGGQTPVAASQALYNRGIGGGDRAVQLRCDGLRGVVPR